MANFSTIPFTGGVVSTGPRDLTWIAISPTKVALLYTAIFNGTTRQIMIQMVTFSGSAAPVYGTPCSLGTISSTVASTFMRGAYLSNNRLVVTIPTAYIGSGGSTVPTTYTYNVVSFDEQDRFALVSTSSSVTHTSLTTWSGHEMTSYNGRVFSMRRPTDDTYVLLEIVVDVNNSISLSVKNTINFTNTGVMQQTQYSRRAGKFWYFQTNAHNTAQQCNMAVVVNLEAVTYFAVPATNMTLPTLSGPLGRARTTTPTGLCVLDVATTGTNFTRYDLTGATVTTAAYRASYTGGCEDIMWLDDKHFLMLLHSATSCSVFNTSGSVTAGTMSVQVCRFDEVTNSMTVSGNPKALGTTSFRENFGNYLHKIDESNIAVIGGYRFATPSTHDGYGVQVISI